MIEVRAEELVLHVVRVVAKLIRVAIGEMRVPASTGHAFFVHIHFDAAVPTGPVSHFGDALVGAAQDVPLIRLVVHAKLAVRLGVVVLVEHAVFVNIVRLQGQLLSEVLGPKVGAAGGGVSYHIRTSAASVTEGVSFPENTTDQVVEDHRIVLGVVARSLQFKVGQP